MLSHIGIDKHKKESSVEILRHEDPVCNFGQLLTPRLVANPLNKHQNWLLKNLVEKYYHYSNHDLDNLGVELIFEKKIANWFNYIFTVLWNSVIFILWLFMTFLVLTKARKGISVERFFSISFELAITNVLVKCRLLPRILLQLCIIDEHSLFLLAVGHRVLFFELLVFYWKFEDEWGWNQKKNKNDYSNN